MNNNIAWWVLICAGCAPLPEPLPVSDLPVPPASSAAATPPAATDLPDEQAARRLSLSRQLRASSGPQAPATVEMLTIAGHSRFGRDRHTHLYALVIAGEVEVVVEPGGERHRLGAWGALWAPGAGIELRGSDARVLLAFVSDGSGAGSYDASPARHWQARPSPGAVGLRLLGSVKPLSWAGGKMHVRLGFEHGPASLSLLYGDAGVGVAPHRHERSWEVIGLLRTGGTFRHARDPAGGADDMLGLPLSSGTLVAIEPPLLHAFEPDDKTPLFAVQLYIPAGPEQRFKQLAAAASQAK